jgi:hypothetical protein
MAQVARRPGAWQGSRQLTRGCKRAALCAAAEPHNVGHTMGAAVCSLLDIDLDYFNLLGNPTAALERMLVWARRPVSFVVRRHNHAFTQWRKRVRSGSLPAPTHILHVDEHHDMMDQKERANISNVMYHAMRAWPECRVHWLVKEAIDSPAMWLSDETWLRIRPRFTCGSRRPRGWPRPDFVSVSSSPEFVNHALRGQLLAVVERFRA